MGKKLKLALVYRKQEPNYHSIENIFDSAINDLSKIVLVEKIICPFTRGIFGKLLNVIYIAIKTRSSDVVHVTGDVHYIIPFLFYKKTILTIHDCRPLKQKNKLKRLIFYIFWFYLPIKFSNEVAVISSKTKKELHELCEFELPKIHIIENFVNPIFLEQNTLNHSYRENAINQVICIGTNDNKNLERLLQAAALSDINLKVIIVGNLNEKQLNMIYHFNLDYENYVSVSNDDLKALYSMSDIVYFASTYEGFGMPILEGNAMGIPVITSNIRPMNEISPGGTLLVDPYCIESIKQALAKILIDHKYRLNIVKQGKVNVNNYSVDRFAKLYLKLYKDFK